MAETQKKNPQSSSSERNIFYIILELIYFVVLFVPNIISALLQKCWPQRGKPLDGLVVLVTGAGRGLGREVALRSALCGAVVACVDYDEAAALETAQEIVRDGEKARAYHKDVTLPAQVSELCRAVAKDLGPVDVLVVNLGSFHSGPVENTTEDTARAVVDANLLAHVWMVKEFLPVMKQQGRGHIVSMSSMVAHSALAGAALYTASCWAVNGFMESVRLEVLLEGYENIHFTLVNAAVLDTSFSKHYSLNSLQKLGTKQPHQVAASIVAEMRKNQVHVNIPEEIYWLCVTAKMLPTTMVDWALKLLCPRPKLSADKTA